MRSWCHERVSTDWQKFRSSENYNKLAYNTEFPWMADGKEGEISMNYAIKNAKNEWEVLRLYTFKNFDDGMYRRDAVIETNENIKFQLTDITLPDGILRVDKVSTPVAIDIRLGHYSLPELNKPIREKVRKVKGTSARIINNGEYQLALIPLSGWKATETLYPVGLHPVGDKCAVSIATDKIENKQIYVTLQLWKKGKKQFSKKELTPVKQIEVADDKSFVKIVFNDDTEKIVVFD
jgi:hypothetical protein